MYFKYVFCSTESKKSQLHSLTPYSNRKHSHFQSFLIYNSLSISHLSHTHDGLKVQSTPLAHRIVFRFQSLQRNSTGQHSHIGPRSKPNHSKYQCLTDTTQHSIHITAKSNISETRKTALSVLDSTFRRLFTVEVSKCKYHIYNDQSHISFSRITRRKNSFLVIIIP